VFKTTRRIATGILLGLIGLCSPSQAKIDWERIETDFEIFLNVTEVVASTILPIVGEIISITGHPEIGGLISEVGKVAVVATNAVTEIEHHQIVNATNDVITIAKEIAEISGDKHATKVIAEIGDIVSGQNLKLGAHESVFPLSASGIEQLHSESVVVSGDESAIGQKSVVTTHKDVQSPFALNNQQKPK